MESFFSTAAGCSILSLAIVVTALPWFALVEPDGFRQAIKKPLNWIYGLVAVLVVAAVLALFVGVVLDSGRLLNWGRLVGALVHLQLIVTFFAVLFPIL